MRIICIGSQKGGVGKTTTAINLAYLLSLAGKKVLLLDADPLGSVSAYLKLGREANDHRTPSANWISEHGHLWCEVHQNLDVLTPYKDDKPEIDLKDCLATLKQKVKDYYDIVLIDSPPYLGERPTAILSASDEIVLVSAVEPMAFRTLPDYLALIRDARTDYPDLSLTGLVVVMPRTNTNHQQWKDRFSELFGSRVAMAFIPHTREVEQALLFGQSLAEFAPAAQAVEMYRKLAKKLNLLEDHSEMPRKENIKPIENETPNTLALERKIQPPQQIPVNGHSNSPSRTKESVLPTKEIHSDPSPWTFSISQLFPPRVLLSVCFLITMVVTWVVGVFLFL